jgi:hypothetical protein
MKHHGALNIVSNYITSGMQHVYVVILFVVPNAFHGVPGHSISN